jgi:hypothetical protein
MTKVPLGTKRKTGEICPESGAWKPVNVGSSTTAPIAKGDRFPPYRNKSAIWELISYI